MVFDHATPTVRALPKKSSWHLGPTFGGIGRRPLAHLGRNISHLADLAADLKEDRGLSDHAWINLD